MLSLCESSGARPRPRSVVGHSRRGPVAILLAAICATAILTSPLHAADPIPVEYLWQSEPDFGIDWFHSIPEFSPSAKPQQILSPSASQRMEAAQAILRAPGNPDFDVPQLHKAIIQRLEAGEPQPNVRAELAAALCALDDGSNAERLWSLLGDDLLLRPTLEEACIGWRSPLPLEMWRERLRERQGSQQELTRALEGIAAAGTQEDLELLTEVVSDGTRPATLRLVAARAIGRLSATVQLALARQLRDSSAAHADLLALAVLGKQSTAEIQEFIADIAEHGSPVAQRHAYQWMCEFDTARSRAKAPAYSQHADAEIRRLSLLQVDQTDSPEAITPLTTALGDTNPQLRQMARELLLSRTSRSSEHKQAVEEALAEHLKESDWKSLEQCVRLTVELEQKVHIPRLLELLENPRPEVCITAAWALRHLATEEATLGAMFEHAQRVVKRQQEAASPGSGVEEFERRRLAHLLEAFGQRRYQPAKETLLLYVPKNQQRMGLITRMAGMWACGKMWEEEGNPKLADDLGGRISDKATMFPEPESVRFAATLALGWLADPRTRKTLVANDEAKPVVIGYATEWALKRIDDKSQPAE